MLKRARARVELGMGKRARARVALGMSNLMRSRKKSSLEASLWEERLQPIHQAIMVTGISQMVLESITSQRCGETKYESAGVARNPHCLVE